MIPTPGLATRYRVLHVRSLRRVILWNVLTVGLYSFYWLPSVSADLNPRPECLRYRFWPMLLACVLSCGLGLYGMEIWLAHEVQHSAAYRNEPWYSPTLSRQVWALNLAAGILLFATGGLALGISLALGIWSTWILQDLLNRRAARVTGPDGAGI